MTAMILTVICVTSLLKIASADLPTEISEQLKTPGQVFIRRELLTDSDLKHVIYAQHGNLFLITYARWDGNMWRWTNDDILEVFIAINQKPHILYSRKPPP